MSIRKKVNKKILTISIICAMNILIFTEHSTACTTKLSNESYSSLISTNDMSNQIVNYAYNFIGTPYVFGANGPNEFDCSGFTSYIYKHFGVNIPRTSQSQFGTGVSVARRNLVQGDLVFFNTYTQLGHVGIYIGNGEFIHAASSGKVKVSSLSCEYYSSRFAGARRVF